jgi:tetratricopeptide (TPR) repeat protein
MTHRTVAPLFALLLLCACWPARSQTAPQTNEPPADPPKAKPASPTPPAIEKAAPDAPVPELGTLPKTGEKPAKSVPERAVRKLKDAAPRCLDAILHTYWAQPSSEDSPVNATAEERAYLKDLDVADFYFKTKNYRGAASRYREALDEVPNAPEATFKLAKSLERLGDSEGARYAFQKFLLVSADTGFAAEACKALQRLGTSGGKVCKTENSRTSSSH